MKSYWERNTEKAKASSKQTRIKRRTRVLSHYGGKCACCGENRYEFLSIDHVDGGGRKHRDKVGANVDRWIIKNNFPSGFRVLCHNCNFAVGLYGSCPHQRPSECCIYVYDSDIAGKPRSEAARS